MRAIHDDGADAIAVSADLTDPDQVASMTDRVQSELGTVDILVNCAGAYPRTAWHDTGEVEWAARY